MFQFGVVRMCDCVQSEEFACRRSYYGWCFFTLRSLYDSVNSETFHFISIFVDRLLLTGLFDIFNVIVIPLVCLFVCLCVCLFVTRISQKTYWLTWTKFYGMINLQPRKNWLDFGIDLLPDERMNERMRMIWIRTDFSKRYGIVDIK